MCLPRVPAKKPTKNQIPYCQTITPKIWELETQVPDLLSSVTDCCAST